MSLKTKRLIAGLVDHYCICFVASGLVGILTLGSFRISLFSGIAFFLAFFLLVLLKDCVFQNASLGKRLFKLVVVKKGEGKVKTGDLLKRNVTVIVLLPLEILMLVAGGTRLGDAWAKTEVLQKNEVLL